MRALPPDASPGGGAAAGDTAGSVLGVGAVPPQLAAILVPLTGSSRVRSGEGAPPGAPDAAPVVDMTWPPLESDIDAVEVIDLDAARHEAPPTVRPPSGRPAGVAAFQRPVPTQVPPEAGQPVPTGATGMGGALAWPPSAEDIDAIAMIDLEAPAATHGAVALAPFELPAPAPVTAPGVSVPPATSRAVPAPPAWGRRAAGVVLVAAVAAGVGYVVTQRTPGPASQPAAMDGAAPAAPLPVEPRAEAPAALPSTPADAPGDAASESAALAPASLAPSASAAATLAESRRLLARGDRASALRLAMSAGSDPEASRLVASVLRGAASASEGARAATLSRVANGDTLESFRLARAQETSAVALWRQGQFDRALEQFALATRGYTAVEAPPTARAAVPAGTTARAAEASAPGAGARETATAVEAVVPATAPSTVVDASGPASPREVRPTPTVAPPTAPEARPAAVVRNDEAGVRRTIEAYRSAFDRLDAAAASAVVPSLDAKALARAFNGLASQRLDFERCDVAVDASTARATCVGRAASVPKVGSSKPRVDPRRWSFALERRGDQWHITNAQVAQR